MPRFAANLSLLFTEVPFLDRFEAAAKAGFKGVEGIRRAGRNVPTRRRTPGEQVLIPPDQPVQHPRRHRHHGLCGGFDHAHATDLDPAFDTAVSITSPNWW